MNNLALFHGFAKGSAKQKSKGSNCVIYTRVSTKEQADNNLSLETQKKACELYAQKNNLNISGYFGGTYESAKTDERKEFNHMLTFVKKSKEKIALIIVYSVDRFSRSGGNAIYIAEQLKKQGIIVCSVTQPIDASTTSGTLQQNIQFIFSEYENQQRKEKCMAGVKEMLLRGEWSTAVPMGYDIVRSEGGRRIVVNSKGKLLRKAFHWKAKEKQSSEEIIRRLAGLGLKVANQKLSKIFRNPFYCGLIVHKALEGQIIEGNHEKLISKEIFLEVNGLLAKNAQGYQVQTENDDVPLKRFLRCDNCGRFLRGYKAYKNQKYYYKCNTGACHCNKRADEIHQSFEHILSLFCVDLDDATRYCLKQQMIATYNNESEDQIDESIAMQSQIADLNKKLERLEERYVMEEITKEMYDKYYQKFLSERRDIEAQIAKRSGRVSNLEECIETFFRVCSKLATAWHLADYNDKQSLQFMIFPDGLMYDKKNDRCRTEKINSAFSYIASQTRLLEEKNRGNCSTILQFPPSVARTGIEPVTFGL